MIGKQIMNHIKNIKFKIVFFSTLCLGCIGIISNFYLYTYMNNIIYEKANDIDQLYLDGIQKHLDTQFAEINNLGILCASSYEVSSALKHNSLNTSIAKKDVFTAQTLINDYLNSSTVSRYINKLFVFNDKNLIIQASAKEFTSLYDLPNLIQSDFYANYSPEQLHFGTIMPSVTTNSSNCVVALFPISNYISPSIKGYLYMEVDLSLITDILEPYSSLNPLIVVSQSGPPIYPNSTSPLQLDAVDLHNLNSGTTLTIEDTEYKVDMRPLSKIGLSIYNFTNLTFISIDDKRKSYALAVVIVSVLLTAIGIAAIFTNFITKPIQKLIARIKRISDNDFSVDTKFQESNDEIGEVFKVVNEMSVSINKLIQENVEKNEQKKNIEIDLLQSQINPHFIYNTLDSIHWMAVIQKNPGISNITRCLSNLLKNMSKGFSHKITLKEELSLLDDYVTIQSIRYLETFELINKIDQSLYHCKIVKLTLQPLVENAIFHGIEPSGVFGTITLNAWIEGDFLLITVTDTGVGMTEEERAYALDTSANKQKNSMNGIGVGNVNKRLQLVYGSPCGLIIESQKGKGTCITLRIKREGENYEIPDSIS